MSGCSPVTHIIFDCDGLIFDSETINLEIYSRIAANYGVKELPINVKQMVLGRTEKDSAEIFVKELKLPVSVDEVRKIRRETARKKLPYMKLFPGAERLIAHLKKCNIPMSLATSSHNESIKLKFTYHQDLLESFDHIVSGVEDPEVKRGKPEPDIFLVSASRFPKKPKPSDCLVFEDSPSGVRAAVAAGMQVVMVPDPMLKSEETKEATLVLESLCDFRPECFGLPPFPC